MSVTFNDHSDELLEAFDEACLRALERCGLQAEGYAKDLVPVNTGALRNSINHKVDSGEPAAYIGTNQEYAPYVEFGTGLFAENGGRTNVPWNYQDDEGNWHSTSGQKPQPFMRPALEDNRTKIIDIMKEGLTND